MVATADRAVLGFDHGLVFTEGGHDVVVDCLVHAAVIDREVAPVHPEVVGVVIVLRRQCSDVVKLDGAGARSVGLVARACAGGGRARVQRHDGGQVPVKAVPGIHVACKLTDLLVKARGWHVDVPAAGAQTAGPRGDFGGELLLRRGAHRVLVDKRQVAEVQQVVGHQRHMGLDVQVTRGGRPAWIAVPGRRQDGGRIGLFWISHPDPDETVFFDQRITAHTHGWIGLGLGGDLYALPLRRKLHTVVHAADPVRLNTAHGQRRKAMRAAVFEGDGFAGCGAKHHHVITQQGTRQGPLMADLVRPGRHCPGIVDKKLLRQQGRHRSGSSYHSPITTPPAAAGVARFMMASSEIVTRLRRWRIQSKMYPRCSSRARA